MYMKFDGFCLGYVDVGFELLKKVYKLLWELDFDVNLYFKEVCVFDFKYVRILSWSINFLLV